MELRNLGRGQSEVETLKPVFTNDQPKESLMKNHISDQKINFIGQKRAPQE